MIVCIVDGCVAPRYAKERCKRCYNRLWASQNLQKNRETKRRYREQNPEKDKHHRRNWRNWSRASRFEMYGLTQESYGALLTAQGGGCAICTSVSRLCVDHDHVTGAVRGILCSVCNAAIGSLGDNQDGLGRALEYLSRAKQ